jgi:hypothetical protein
MNKADTPHPLQVLFHQAAPRSSSALRAASKDALRPVADR